MNDELEDDFQVDTLQEVNERIAMIKERLVKSCTDYIYECEHGRVRGIVGRLDAKFLLAFIENWEGWHAS